MLEMDARTKAIGIITGGRVEKFCNEVCSYSHLKILEPKVWKHLDPCLNCCVDHFVDWLEKVPEKGCK